MPHKQLIRNIAFQFAYLFRFKASCKYKAWYAYSLLVKLAYHLFWKGYVFSKFPFPGDYEIENSLGKFIVREPSDMHSILNPNFENDIYQDFQKVSGKGIFLDIGANVGKFSIMVSKNTSLETYAFEPNGNVRKYLAKNLELNGISNVTIVGKALSDVAGTVEFYVPWDNFGSGSLKQADGWQDRIRVETMTLDSFIEENGIDCASVRLIKIDVEGNESSTLKWAEKTLPKLEGCKVIIESFAQEFERSDIAGTFTNAGFKLSHRASGDNYVFIK